MANCNAKPEPRILIGDAASMLATLDAGSVHTCVTSPPYYGLRNYGVDGQIGLEETPDAYVSRLVDVFRGVRRVLRDDGTLWLNLGDSYTGNASSGGANRTAGPAFRVAGVQTKLGPGLKPKDLIGIPWRVAFALQADGWYLRQDIIWHKPSPMPESVRDRCTKAHEYVFLLSKSERYFFDAEAIKEPSDAGTKNRRSVWTIASQPYKGSHYATFPARLAAPCVQAGTSERGACSACGAPWERVTERAARKRERPNDYVKRDGAEGTGNSCANTIAGVEVRTVAWLPSCRCNCLVTSPCMVLDPFAGSGTTLAVAAQLGRASIGVDIDPRNEVLMRERIAKGVKL